MPITYPRVTFGLYALSMKLGATFACDDVQTFSKVTDLKTGNVATKPYATYEPDFWVLDGGYKFKPVDDDIVHVGLMSLSMSDENGSFAVSPELSITFENVQSIDGITIRFSRYTDDYAANIDIGYYDTEDNLIYTDSFEPDSWEFSVDQSVDSVKKIIIFFNNTNKPYRYLRVTGIDFGTLITFEGSAIQTATVVQEIHPISLKLPIDTLELSLFSNDSEFSIINPTGAFSKLKENQPLDIYEFVNSEIVYIGQFYLSTWENPTDNQIKFKAIDRFGVIDGLEYLGGIWTTATNAEDLIDEILTAVNAPYELDPELIGEQIKGWLPICTYREALQQIAFAIGAHVTCSRAGVIRIIKTTLASEYTEYEYTITKAQKGVDQKLVLLPFVTGVEVTTHNYINDATSTTLFNGTLTAGTHTIKFSEPHRSLSVSGATISESGANYAILTVASTGTVTLSGLGYKDTQTSYSVVNGALDADTPERTVTIKNVTLIHNNNAATIAQRVYDYYQQRYQQDVKLYAPSVEPGKSVSVETLYNREIGGVMEKMEIDLANGFTAKAKIVGVVLE